MVECPTCGMELDERTTNMKAVIGEKAYYFCSEYCLKIFDPLGRMSDQSLLNILLSKTFFELAAIGTGIGGILYTLQGITIGALILDTSSAITAIMALTMGIEKLPLLKEYKLVKKAIIPTVLGVLSLIVILVWHFGFHS